MINWKSVLFGVFLALLASGLILLVSKQTYSSEFELMPVPTSRPFVVHIAGGVASPGVYRVPVESRISDVVAAAGGFAPNAAPDALNLSQFVADGQKIVIPISTDDLSLVSSKADPVISSSPAVQVIININTAGSDLLSTLPGIGQVKAADIIAYRNAHGPFTSIDELMSVQGIGPGNFEKIKDLVTLQ